MYIYYQFRCLCVYLLLWTVRLGNTLQNKGCSCNGVTDMNKEGDCLSTWNGNAWCYVDADSGCRDTKLWDGQYGLQQTYSYLACNNIVDECQTEDGEACIFPFKWEGFTYAGCTSVDNEDDIPWCATSVNSTSYLLEETSWSNCLEDCAQYLPGLGAKSSSIYKDNEQKFGPHLAIDGNAKTYFKSQPQMSANMTIKLPQKQKIDNLSLQHEQMAEMSIVAFLSTSLKQTSRKLCGKFSKASQNEGMYYVKCNEPLIARYIFITILEKGNHSLQIGEIKINEPSKGNYDIQIKSNTNTHLIILGVTVIIIFVGLVIYIKKQKRQIKSIKKRRKQQPELPEWASKIMVSRGHMDILENLGSGAFGIVSKAQIQNFGAEKSTIMPVAVKTYSPGCLEGENDLRQEGELLSKLQYHFNIINLLATTQDTAEESHRLMLIIELCQGGCLEDLLTTKKEEIRLNTIKIDDADFNMKLLVSWTYQVAMGMEFLAKNRVIHGDLATRNILLDSNNVAKISDFGKSHKINYDNIGVDVSGGQPLLWMAPEALQRRKITLESDVWSYGVTVWEIFSLGEMPYLDKCSTRGMTGLLEELNQGYRMPQPKQCPNKIYEEVVLPCWNGDPNQRPAWPPLTRFLETLVDSKYLRKYRVMANDMRNNYDDIRNIAATCETVL